MSAAAIPKKQGIAYKPSQEMPNIPSVCALIISLIDRLPVSTTGPKQIIKKIYINIRLIEITTLIFSSLVNSSNLIQKYNL